jgi:hypothetical protein
MFYLEQRCDRVSCNAAVGVRNKAFQIYIAIGNRCRMHKGKAGKGSSGRKFQDGPGRGEEELQDLK